MLKALIITYYWPPSGGAGVQRWLKMTKYFREFDIEPVIYTAENPDMAMRDLSLLSEVPEGIEVIKHPVWEPYDLYRKLLGKPKSESVNQGFISESKKAGFMERVAMWVRGNFFIPDARKFWIRPSVKFLRDYLKTHAVDVVVSTGPPHSMHMIALDLHKNTGLPWIADFRDPWTNIDFYDQLHLTDRADKLHRRMEQQVLQQADCVVTVSRSWAEDFKQLGRTEVEVISNGFDDADFPAGEVDLLPGFVLHHIGSMNKDRNPHVLWNVLKNICIANPDFKRDLKIRLTGKNDYSVIESIEANALTGNLELIPYMPHAEIVRILPQSTVLLLPLNDTPNVAGVIPGKLFEYLAAKRPVLCIGDTSGDTAAIIAECKAGYTCGFTDEQAIHKALTDLYNKYRGNTLYIHSKHIENYTRKGGAKKFAALMKQLANPQSPARYGG